MFVQLEPSKACRLYKCCLVHTAAVPSALNTVSQTDINIYGHVHYVNMSLVKGLLSWCMLSSALHVYNLYYIPPFVVKCQRLQGICLYLPVSVALQPSIQQTSVLLLALLCVVPSQEPDSSVCGGVLACPHWSGLSRCVACLVSQFSPLSVEPRPSLAGPQRSQLCLIIWSDPCNISSQSLFMYLL